MGKIAEEEIEYLMTRGLSRDEAVSVIVRGFLSVDIEGLPPELSAQMQHAIEMSERELLSSSASLRTTRIPSIVPQDADHGENIWAEYCFS